MTLAGLLPELVRPVLYWQEFRFLSSYVFSQNVLLFFYSAMLDMYHWQELGKKFGGINEIKTMCEGEKMGEK